MKKTKRLDHALMHHPLDHLSSAALIRAVAGDDLPANLVGALQRGLAMAPPAQGKVLGRTLAGRRILAALELAKRLKSNAVDGGPQLLSPAAVVAMARSLPEEASTYRLTIALDDTLHTLQSDARLLPASPSLNADAAHLLGLPLAAGAKFLVVVDGHSAGPRPLGAALLKDTLDFEDLARHLGVCLVDRILLATNGFVSLRRRGVLSPIGLEYG